MPRKLCFAALLAFALLAARGFSQQFESTNFGARVSARVASDSTAPAGDVGPSHLVQPAIYQTPDRFVPSGQLAAHSEPPDGEPSGQQRTEISDNVPAAESPDDTRSAATADRSQGFPALAPPGTPTSTGAGTPKPTQGLGAVVTVVSSLTLVLGLFFITAWFMRRTGAGGLGTLPGEVFEVLGRAQLNHRQQVHLLRCGSRLLLVSLTPDCAETLTEIDDPDEVTRLAGLCRANQAGSASAAFRQVFHQFAGQPVEPGFIGRTESRSAHAELRSELENLHG